jgi:hypothetical protein
MPLAALQSISNRSLFQYQNASRKRNFAMSNDPHSGEKKLYVDEDWKTQVEAEKTAAGEPTPATQEEPQRSADPLPPPTLTFLASTLYLQGAISMGLLPNPISDKQELQLDRAKHAIDVLAMLQEKTEGNRTPEETREFEEMLHQLRMAYVELNKG